MPEPETECASCDRFRNAELWNGSLIAVCPLLGIAVAAESQACSDHEPARIGRIFDGKGAVMDGPRERPARSNAGIR